MRSRKGKWNDVLGLKNVEPLREGYDLIMGSRSKNVKSEPTIKFLITTELFFLFEFLRPLLKTSQERITQ